MPPDWTAERAKAGGAVVTGVDEAGRGALAGPVVAAAYRFHQSGTRIPGLDDSKKLTPKKREEIYLRLTGGEAGVWAVSGLDTTKPFGLHWKNPVPDVFVLD
ncbi:MAG: hypothetical protein EBT68_04785, partial [Verrucomicrobia bacterium]|nr:hypothetical protein [Verrucomicrobiota bacterium]